MFAMKDTKHMARPPQVAGRPLRRIYLLACALALVPVHAINAADSQKSTVNRGALQDQLEAAQKRLEEAAREVADLSMSLSEDVLPQVMPYTSGVPQNAVLGVNIGPRRDEERDDGVEVLSVSPGGAAAAAGLQAGDILTEVDGKSLQRAGDQSPRSRLLAAMREVKAGDQVSVRYRRADKSLSANVTAQRPARRMFNVPFAVGAMRGKFEGGPDMIWRRPEGVFGAMEMVALTPKLGQYFGSDKGLLVVRAPGDDRLKLEEGDVIVDIDGRVPESAAHASRILGSYEPGEKLRLNVLRMKKRLALEVQVPADPVEKKFEQRIERSRFITGHDGDFILPAPVPVPLPPPRADDIL
jgi:C-terminal processing protease CtpA/Prc